MNSVTVTTSSKRYDVRIGSGLLSRAGELSAALREGGTAMIVSDSGVAPLYAGGLAASLESAGFKPVLHVIPEGEKSKNAHCLFEILNDMAEQGMTRADTVFALGGGVAGDMAGLAASLYMRGIGLVQLPTSLLAAVDSSVGGKTAIDLEKGKNLAGTFYQPDLVLYDTDTAASLSDVQTANGLGEIIKTGMIRDERLFEAAAKPDALKDLERIVSRCVEIKSAVVQSDEKETGLRQILNFGHTFGHAAEKLSGFSIPHGYCVAVGMTLITAASVKRGICPPETLSRLAAALKAHGLPVSTDFGADEMFKAMLSDKKRAGDSVSLVLPLEVGRVERRKTALDEARAFLEDGLAAARGAKGAAA